MLKRFGFGIVVMAGIVAMTGCSSQQKHAINFGEVIETVEAVTVMPGTVAVTKEGAFSTEGVPRFTAELEKEVKQAAEAILVASRFDLAALDCSEEAMLSDPEMRRLLARQADEIAEVSAAISEVGSSKVIDIRYDADIDFFADRTDADFFLFIDTYGNFRTMGSVVKDAIVAGVFTALFGGYSSSDPSSWTLMQAYLVDAVRGNVLWYNQTVGNNRDPRKPSHLFRTCQDLLKPLTGKLDIEVDKSRDDEIIDRYEAEIEALEAEAEAAAPQDPDPEEKKKESHRGI